MRYFILKASDAQKGHYKMTWKQESRHMTTHSSFILLHRKNIAQETMKTIRAEVSSQSEFTAQRIAAAAGISTVWLYKIAGSEFRALRAELPGSRKTRDEEIANLRQENTQLRTQLKEAQEQARLASSNALKKAIAMLEQWEQENLELCGHIRVLTRRLEQVGGYVDITVTPSPVNHKGHLKPIDA